MRNKAYWIDQLGEKWTLNLKEILKDPYMNKLMNFITLEYSMRTIYPADQKEIFKAFRLCSWDDVKVVIIGKEVGFHTGIFPLPYSDDYIHTYHNGSLNKISSCIEREYHEGLNLDFDYSLEPWMKQGVLFLNTAMTVERGKSGSHIKPWKKFYEAVIQQIVEYKPGTIFLLWGEEALEQSTKLENQHVFSWESPHIASLERRDWNCPNFKQVDKLMEHLYGTGNTIKW